jgi:hypothetical protein
MYLVFNVFYFYSAVGQKDSGVGRAHLAPPLLRPWFLYKQPNVTMTPEHIMQTRSTQSILKRVFGFN